MPIDGREKAARIKQLLIRERIANKSFYRAIHTLVVYIQRSTSTYLLDLVEKRLSGIIKATRHYEWK